jgi:hypothetical protein
MTITQEAPGETEAPPRAEVAVRVQPGGIPAKLAYARELANSGLLPSAYRRQPANVLYAVEYGEMLGLAPMAAITGIHIIEGKPSASAGLISALVRRAGHKLRVRGDSQKATCQIVRSDDPDYTFEVTWTLRRNGDGHPSAEEAGLTGKQVWKQYPASMLKSRVITQCARDACEEALFGLHYTPEELGAEVDADGAILGEIVPDAGQGQRQADPWAVQPHQDQHDPAWVSEAIDRAARVTEADYAPLWAEATAGMKSGRCTVEEGTRIHEVITARMEDVRKDAGAQAEADGEPIEGVIVPDALEPEDPWAVKVEDITSAEDAKAAKADLQVSLKNGSVTYERGQQILAAIEARVASVEAAVAA